MKWTIALMLGAFLVGCSDDKPASQNNDAGLDVGSQDFGQDSGADVSSDATDLPDADAGTDAAFACDHTEPAYSAPAVRTPRWAFLPWISKDISDAADTYAFVEGFKTRDIPVGVVVLDSPWETHYNTFIPNPDRYPGFEQMVTDLRAQDVRVVLWVTQMVNDLGLDAEPGGDAYAGPASNYEEGKVCGYYVQDGRNYLWWKGRGAGVDFFNPAARAWWHAQQNALLDLGIAGWKLDFGESYIRTDVVKTAAGDVPHQDYSEAYYQDFWEYGAARAGTENFLTMVRGYDASYDFEGRFFARPEHAPVVWAGDNRRDWVGLQDALDHMFVSAAAGYVVVGSDLGGYLDRDDVDLGQVIPANRNNFLRWTAASALSPFMQLHGRANLTPWTFPGDTTPEETADIYKFWSVLHTELVPFLYGLSEEGFKDFTSILQPVGPPESWPGDYRYTLGQHLLVAPILDDSGARDVTFPDGTWFNLWTGEAHSGTESLDISADFRTALVFAAPGSIVPMRIDSAITKIGDEDLDGHLSLLIVPGNGQFTLHEDANPASVVMNRVDSRTQIDLPNRPEITWLRVQANDVVVRVDNQVLQPATDRAVAGPNEYVVDGPFIWFHVLPGQAHVVELTQLAE